MNKIITTIIDATKTKEEIEAELQISIDQINIENGKILSITDVLNDDYCYLYTIIYYVA